MSYGLEVLNRIDVAGDPVNWVDPWGLATYKDFEGHAVLGAGLLEIKCCSENGDGFKHLYVKFCLGAALEISGGWGGVADGDGKNCSNPATFMLGGELGAAIGVGAEGSATADTAGGGDVGLAGGIGLGAGKIGAGAKATGCWYMLLQTIPSGEECECKSDN